MYTFKEISMCKGQEVVTASGNHYIIDGFELGPSLVRLRYDDTGIGGISWVTANLIVSIPWFETFKNTKMCKVILL